jgi:Fic family protein
MSYQPPYVITPVIIDLISRISESLGRLSAQHDMADLRLRRINRIKTIQGSLAIEGNTLSEDQVETILQGKTVVAPSRRFRKSEMP